MLRNNYKLFEVAGEYIIAQTKEKALQDHLQRIGNWQDWYGDDLLPEPEEVSLEEIGLFEQEQGGYKEMTYREFIDDCFGGEYEFKGAELVCWREV